MIRVFASVLLIALLTPLVPLRADVTLPQIIGSNMVLQREQPVAFFGTADAGEEVRVVGRCCGVLTFVLCSNRSF